MTGGAVACLRCPGKVLPCDIGYLPLYRCIDARPVFVVLHEHTREEADKLRHLSRVIVGREKGPGEGVWVHTALTQSPAYHSLIPGRMDPQDLSETLLRVWNIPELTQWYRLHCGRSDNAVSMPKRAADQQAAPLTSTGEEFGPMTAAAARRWGEPMPADGAINDSLRRLQLHAAQHEPSKNGKHKKKE